MDCDVCGRDIDHNYNRANISGRYSPVATLCFLHAEAAIQVSNNGIVNWLAMAHATIRLRQEEPNLFEEPERYVEWDPLPRLVALYRAALAEYPKDLPPPT